MQWRPVADVLTGRHWHVCLCAGMICSKKKKKRKKSDASVLAPEYMIPGAIYSDWVKLAASQITPFIACTCLCVSSVCVYNPFCSLCSRNRISKSKFRLVPVVSQSLFHSPAVVLFFLQCVCVVVVLFEDVHLNQHHSHYFLPAPFKIKQKCDLSASF